jgi:hypothetical protein
MVAILLTLSGCAAVDHVAYGRSSATYANAYELSESGGGAPLWLPTDATEITHVSSSRAQDTESLLFRSDEGLGGCEEVPRVSAPTMEIADGPDVYAIDRVALCEDWAVAESDGTYYAWTPAKEADAP